MNIKREDLLRKLNSVAPGISTKENVEQSSCFVFLDDMLYTYNEEVFCSISCPIGFNGAVESKSFLDILGRLNEETLECEPSDNELLIKGKSKKIGIALAAEIKLPIDSVTLPKEKAWEDLDDDFSDAVGVVAECAGKKKTEFILSCVHITPKHIEACDNMQLSRYRIKTPIKENTLVRKESIKSIIGLGMGEVAETKSFIHFRNGDGLIMSCRRYSDEYQDLTAAITVDDGVETDLPKGLADAAEKAAVFTTSSEDENVTVVINKGMVTVSSRGSGGWYKERRKVKYKGEKITFKMAPKIMADIVKKHDTFVISSNRIKVEDDHFTYVSCLNVE